MSAWSAGSAARNCCSDRTPPFFPSLSRSPAWKELRELAFDARLEAIRDGATREKLVAEAKADPTVERQSRQYYWLGDGDRPHYTRDSDESLYGLAKASGEHPAEVWLRYALESNGNAMFHVRFFNHDLDAVATLLTRDWGLPGIGDAGAHVSQIMDAGWATFVLSHWYRDTGVYSLAEAIRKLTSAPARVIGLTDRGTLGTGQRADINVIDMERVAERQPDLVHDFPGGASRLTQKAVGYRATVCNGQVMLRDDEHTGARGGRVLRNSA